MNPLAHSHFGLENHEIKNTSTVYWNLSTPRLYEEALRRHEGHLAHLGPLVVRTGHHTGRSPDDKFIVKQNPSAQNIGWGKLNRPISPNHFENLHRRLLAYLEGKDLFIQDCFVRSDPKQPMPIRIVTEMAWHSLFARNLFLQAKPDELQTHVPELTLLHAPQFHAVPEKDGTHSETFIILNFERKLILIGGTAYAGEIKKSVFTAMNFFLPQKHVLSLHSSANQGPAGDVALFFGLSGTGKTTLSTDPARKLIGDDELGWNDAGVFNLEGGCYAKVIRLSAEAEPEIYQTTRRFGTVLENVGFISETGSLDLNDDSLTENTRAAYPIRHIQNIAEDGVGPHPRTLILLTADAFGVLPPISKLTHAQAVYYFLAGYTAKVAGTESNIKEPQAVFSPCFGAPFMALPPTVYANLLGEKLARHNVDTWLINTGWTGGPYGTGHRIPIAYTRQMANAAISGALNSAPMSTDPIFCLAVPSFCPEVPADLLQPKRTWQNPSSFDEQAKKLARMFQENFKIFSAQVSEEIAKAGPCLPGN